MAKPFFKWPGSKSWFINLLSDLLPHKFLRVVEPFAGSSAFYLGSGCHEALLADTNHHAVACLSAVRDNPFEVLSYLSQLHNSREDYLRVRSEIPLDEVSAAGRLIFLTNTSWGGLYRENRQGKFNVPFGNNGRRFYCEDAILSASIKLKNVELQHWSYEKTLSKSKKNDLIFIDAPYVTKSSKHFDRYHSSRFTWSDQLKLANLLNNRNMEGGMMLVTCAADPELYKLFVGWKIFEFTKRNSMAAHMGKAGYRKEALLISTALRDFADSLELEGLGTRVNYRPSPEK